jgi:hypothetical protein
VFVQPYRFTFHPFLRFAEEPAFFDLLAYHFPFDCDGFASRFPEVQGRIGNIYFHAGFLPGKTRGKSLLSSRKALADIYLFVRIAQWGTPL